MKKKGSRGGVGDSAAGESQPLLRGKGKKKKRTKGPQKGEDPAPHKGLTSGKGDGTFLT